MAANHYNITTQNSSSSSPPRPPHEPDDISLFLQQIILRSSSSSSSFTRQQSFATYSNHILVENQGLAAGPGSGQISVPYPSLGLNSSSGCSFTAANLSSSSVANFDNEADEYDYESEEVVEAAVEETTVKPAPRRSSSKRSRAAEVHNQSEKRRRSRINEKMKALQNLIPNSNKTDKASMLDEAIEYLKQLQLQVQMLTMRNGSNLYPVCGPGMMHPNQMLSEMRTNMYDTNTAKSVSTAQNSSADASLRVDEKRVNHAPFTDFSSVIGSKTSYGIDSSVQDHFGTFQRSRSARGNCEEKVRLSQPMNDYCPQTISTGAKTSLISLGVTNISNSKENTLEEAACLAGGEHLLENFVNHPIFSSQFDM